MIIPYTYLSDYSILFPDIVSNYGHIIVDTVYESGKCFYVITAVVYNVSEKVSGHIISEIIIQEEFLRPDSICVYMCKDEQF